MRDIKFRAWDKKNKTMLDVQKMSFKTKKILPYGWNIEYYEDDFELMQYTGLKDMNGVDIFEGDIVKRTSGLIGDKYEDFIGVVKFECGAFIIENFEKTDGTYLWSDVQYLEILGNIYEKPELLEGLY